MKQICGQTVYILQTERGGGAQKLQKSYGRHIWKPPYCILAESRVESSHRTTAPPPSEEEPQSEPEPPDKKLLSPIAEVAPPIPPPRSPSPGIVITLDEIHRKVA